MKSFAKWTGIVVLFLISVGMLTLPLCDLWFAKSRDFEYRTYVLCSGFVLLLFAMIQTKINRTWGKWTLAACPTAFLTIGVFLYNNLLHYLFLKPIFFGTDYSYLAELKHDINYTEGLGVFRYVLYFLNSMTDAAQIIRYLISHRGQTVGATGRFTRYWTTTKWLQEHPLYPVISAAFLFR